MNFSELYNEVYSKKSPKLYIDYTLKEGDTIVNIAKKFEVNHKEILRESFGSPTVGEIVHIPIKNPTHDQLVNRYVESAKDLYNLGFQDGVRMAEEHFELCKDEGTIIQIPNDATNLGVLKLIFPKAKVIAYENEEMEIVEYIVKIDDETPFTSDWCFAPYNQGEE